MSLVKSFRIESCNLIMKKTHTKKKRKNEFGKLEKSLSNYYGAP